MTANRSLSRRHLIGGIGAAGVAAATGVGLGGVAAASSDPDPDGDAGRASHAEPSPIGPRDLPNPIVQPISILGFQGLDSTTYTYLSPGGLQVTGDATFLTADVNVPAGATIVGAKVFLNPNGAVRTVRLRRYRNLEATFETIDDSESTAGAVREEVNLTVDHLVEAGWTYHLGQLQMGPAGAILYGGEVSYTLPPDPTPPTGVFVPFAGVNPRVYDSRTGAGKLAANQERVIPLGVPGTVKGAMFNLTVTETETAGFVACFKADIPWPGNSSINWYESGANTANLVVCAVNAAGAIKIRGGNDDTHVVIDLIGTFA